jgi:hypothetical protein
MKNETNKPIDVFRAFLDARQNSNVETIKSTLSQDTLSKIEKISAAQEKTFYQAINIVNSKIYGHSISETPSKPLRELVVGDTAFIEVRNNLTNELDGFIFEKKNDVWKLALDCEVLEVIENDENDEDSFEKLVE